MSEQADPKELLGKVSDPELRSQLESVFGALDGSALRKERDDAVQLAKTLQGEKRQRTYKDAGIPESAFDVLDKVYDGELDPSAVRTFAQEKGFALSGDGTPAAPTDPAEQRAAGEQRLQQVNSGALPIRDASIDDQIQQAISDGNTTLAGQLNAQKLAKLRASA